MVFGRILPEFRKDKRGLGRFTNIPSVVIRSKNRRDAFRLQPGNKNDTYNISGKSEFI